MDRRRSIEVGMIVAEIVNERLLTAGWTAFTQRKSDRYDNCWEVKSLVTRSADEQLLTNYGVRPATIHKENLKIVRRNWE